MCTAEAKIYIHNSHLEGSSWLLEKFPFRFIIFLVIDYFLFVLTRCIMSLLYYKFLCTVYSQRCYLCQWHNVNLIVKWSTDLALLFYLCQYCWYQWYIFVFMDNRCIYFFEYFILLLKYLLFAVFMFTLRLEIVG